MKILIFGGAGYLGSVLTERLLMQGHQVMVLDNFSHGCLSLAHLCFHPNLQIVRRDVMGIDLAQTKEFDVVIPLAAVVGAEACKAEPTRAVVLNLNFIRALCDQLPSGVSLIYPCTNSGYGVGGAAECDESSPLNPISLYGRTKVDAERAVLERPNSVSLRLATLFGWSPRMRRDLLVNDMVWRAVRDRSVVIFEGGFRRNFCHVRDAAHAFAHVIDNWDAMKDQAYNVGDTRANMTKLDLCAKIQDAVPEFRFLAADHASDPDKRDYVVSNAKIEATGWKPLISLEHGINELLVGYQMMRKEEHGNV